MVKMAKVKNSKAFTKLDSKAFTKLDMYTESNGKVLTYSIKEENTNWKTIKIENIEISSGKVEVGFIAEGAANSFCYVDDVLLLKKQ